MFIDAGEQAVLEHFGKPVATLGPGAHFKLPWPADKIYRFRTEQIQSFAVGYTPDAQSEAANTILWTVAHAKEENFLVANRALVTSATTSAGTNDTAKAQAVGFITVSIPVQFQITNVMDWVYKNSEPDALLQDLATREVIHYFAGVDLNEVLSQGRLQAADALRDRIQNSANARSLGAKIIFVGLQDIHPPTANEVAATYEKVVGAEQTKLAKILDAEAAAIRTNALADAQAFTVTNVADANRIRQVTSAFARAALFTNQIPAFAAAPSVYRQRLYLQKLCRRDPERAQICFARHEHAGRDDLRSGRQNPRRPAEPFHHQFAMKKNLITVIIAAVLVVIFALLLFTFQVRQSEVAVLTTFGKPAANNIDQPNLYFKWPWPIQKVYRFDQRVQNFEDKFSENLTADSTMLLTSVYVGWRISDAKEFFPKFAGGSIAAAQRQLETMLRSAKAAVIGKHNLSDFVNSDPAQLKFEAIENEIKTAVQNELAAHNYGISIEFLGIKKLGLPESVTQTVFDRMKSERTKLISEAQNQGRGRGEPRSRPPPNARPPMSSPTRRPPPRASRAKAWPRPRKL